MSDKFDFENELADSIAQIVDEETCDAEEYVRNNYSNKRDYVEEEADEEDEEDVMPSKKPKFVLPIILGVLALAIIVVAAIVGKKMYDEAISNSTDNYAYYNNLGYSAYDQKDYVDAIAAFEKALTYKEGEKQIDMRMYLYDCYVETGKTEEAHKLLLDVLKLDPNYLNAIIYLVQEYEEKEDFVSIQDLYDQYKDSSVDDIKNLFNRFMGPNPKASVSGGNFSSDISVELICGEGCTLYYAMGGKDPITSGTIYEGTFEFSEGTYTIKFYSKNKYGFVSDVQEETYIVKYEAPAAALLSPGSGSYETTDIQYITITGVTITSTAYYTLDGSEPNATSKKYSGPFELPVGNTTIKVIVIDDNTELCSTVTTATYTLKKTIKYGDSECQDLIWKEFRKQGYCRAKDHKNSKTKKLYEIEYYSKKKIQDQTIFMYTVVVGGEKQDYYVGCDANTGTIFQITEENGEYVLSILPPYSAEETTTPEETTAEESSAEETKSKEKASDKE